MKFSIRFADKIVGTLVVLALAIFVVVIFMIGRNQRWFKRDYQYRTYYDSASGFSRNMPVQYMGFTVGYVKKINLVTDDADNNNDRVEIIFSIFEEYSHIARVGSMVEIQVSPIGLGNTFVFYSGKGYDLVQEGSVIPEFSSPAAKRNIAVGLVDRTRTAGDGINNIIFQLNDLLEKINNAVTGPQTEEYTIIAQIMMNIEALTQSLDAVTGRMSDPSGTVMSFLDTDSSLYSGLSTSIDSITGILDNLDKTSDFLPSNLPRLLIDLNAALRSARDVMTSMTNNPLLRGGIPEQREASPGGSGPRNQEF